MELLSLRQAARELHVAERTLREAVRTGELKATKLGTRTLRVRPEWLDDWIEMKMVPNWRSGNGAKK